jgi:hypothetical protein
MRTLIALSFVLIVSLLNGQACTNFKYFKTGAEIEMSHYDKKGKLTSKSTSKVKSVGPISGGRKH